MPDTMFHAVRNKKMREWSLLLKVLKYGQEDDTVTGNNHLYPTDESERGE